MSVKISDKDKGYAKILAVLTQKDHPVLKVGILSEDGAKEHGEGLTVAEVGAFHEFGLGNNPERSFIRGWVDENQQKATTFLREQCEKSVKSGQGIELALERLGLYCQSGIQQRMSDGIPPPLTKQTIARKGSSTPLIDTGQLRSSISYSVDK